MINGLYYYIKSNIEFSKILLANYLIYTFEFDYTYMIIIVHLYLY